jgi:zinc transport system substrate-binding protein
MGIRAKSIIPLILISLAISGCGKKSGGGDGAFSDGGRIAAASFYPVYIAALNVTDGAEGIRLVNMAAPDAGCLHGYQLTPADAALLEKASAVIVSDLGAEREYLGKFESSHKHIAFIDASRGEGLRLAIDTHVWLDIENHIRQIKNIAAQLSAWDTANAEIYNRNARSYAAKLTELKESAISEMSTIGKNSRSVALDHLGLYYFIYEFDVAISTVIEPNRHTGEPSAAEIVAAINAIKADKPRAIIADNAHPSAPSRTISAETGVPIIEIDMVVTGPPEKDAYIRAMEKNIAALKKALD